MTDTPGPEQLYARARDRMEQSGERFGQALFNTLQEMRPDLAERVRSTDCDPFYAREETVARIDRFFQFVDDNWSTGPDMAQAGRIMVVPSNGTPPHEPVQPNTNRRHTWDEFRETGLLWELNRHLHVFGWSIVVETDDDGNTLVAYPVRTEWRGFPRDRDERGFILISEWMAKAAPAIREETNR